MCGQHECQCKKHEEATVAAEGHACKCGKHEEATVAAEGHACKCGKHGKKPLEAVATDDAPAALGAYSQAVKANGFVFVSGQLGLNPATGELAGATVAEQAEQALKNIAAILTEAGSGTDRIVRATIYLADVADFQEVDKVYAAALTGDVKPARVAFGGNAIPKGALVEIDAIAAL